MTRKATTSRSRTGTSPCTQQNLYNVVQNTTNGQVFVKTGGIAVQSSLQNTCESGLAFCFGSHFIFGSFLARILDHGQLYLKKKTG